MSSQQIPSMYMSDRSVTYESYNIVGDYWEDTQYGDKRSLSLEHRDGSLLYVCLPHTDSLNKTSLFGSVMTKRVTTEFFLDKDKIELNLDATIDERSSRKVKPATLHTPSCSICDQSFTNPYSLVRHARCQHSEKKFKCPTCGRAFSRHDGMKLHKRICKK
jgi:uncharacterized Zn-finger protein